MSDPPTREDLLGCTDPAALFGSDTDAVALRRAYASLAKTWRDDTEVTRHVRALYEQARQIADHGPTDEPADVDATASSPLAQLQQAHRELDTDQMIALLRTHADAYVAAGGPWLALTLQVLVFGVGERLSQMDLDFVETVAMRPDLSLDPGLAQALERGTRTLRAVARAEEDHEVPPVITGAIRGAWHQPSHVVARVWLDARAHAENDGVDLATALQHLERHHPTVLGAFRHAELRMIRDSEDRNVPDSPALDKAREAYPPSIHLAGVEASWMSTRLGVGLLSIALFAGIAPFLGVLYGAVVAWGLARVIGVVARMRRNRTSPVINRLHQAPIEPLYQVSRDLALWPHELAMAVTPEQPIPFDEDWYAYTDEHPLIRFRMDHSATMRCMTLAHVARVPEPADD